jgi:hypothetical protein
LVIAAYGLLRSLFRVDPIEFGRRFVRFSVAAVSVGLPRTARKLWEEEVQDYVISMIWDDLKAGRTANEVGGRVIWEGAALVACGWGDRQHYRRLAKRSANMEPRKGKGNAETHILGEARVDLTNGIVRMGADQVSLTTTECRLLSIFIERRGRPLSKRQLLTETWGDDFVKCDNYLRLYVGYLKEKIEENSASPKLFLKTRLGRYKLAR